MGSDPSRGKGLFHALSQLNVHLYNLALAFVDKNVLIVLSVCVTDVP